MINGLIIIGLGQHTKNKIIPLLEELNVFVKGIVTSTNLKKYKNIKLYNSLDNLLKNEKISHCIISTTPSKQFFYIKKLLPLGVKLYVEKPAFVDKEDLLSLKIYFEKENNLLTEGLMYRFGNAYKYLCDNFIESNSNFEEISIKFILPNKFRKTPSFRDSLDKKNSIIYDIGPYVVDMIWVLQIFEFQIKRLKVEKFENTILKKITLLIYPKNKPLQKLNITFGYDEIYQNKIQLKSYNDKTEINPFFWGRSGIVNIKNTKSLKITRKSLKAQNASKELMSSWIFNKKNIEIKDIQNLERYKFSTSILNKLEKLVYAEKF